MLLLLLLLMLTATPSAAQNGFSVINSLENQNVGLCEYDAATNTVKFAPYIDSVNTCGVWFNFGVSGYRRDTVLTFKTLFAKTVHSPFFPVVSNDNIDFQHVRQTGVFGGFILRLTPENDTTYIATGFPYTYSRLQNFLDEIKDSKILTIDTLFTTRNNLNVNLLTITKKPNSKRKKLVWILCRQHAFESVSNFVMEGMIRYLLSDGCNQKLLKKYIFKIVPMVDVESVYNGQSGRMQLPIDFNRDWDGTPYHPAIRRIEQAIRESAQNYSYSMFWDVHGMFPGGFEGNSFSYYDLYSNGKKHSNLVNFWHKFARLSGFTPKSVKDTFNNYDGMTADWWNEINYGHSLQFSTTIETDWNLNSHGIPYSIEDYLNIGKWIVKALE